ncbi:hypothetical protein Tco_0612909 [Tanacetum coccineum]
MSTQQEIYADGSENRPPMLNKDNYVPWSSRLIRYAKSKPNGNLIYNSIMHGIRLGQDRRMHMIKGNGGNQNEYDAVQNTRNQVVQNSGIQNVRNQNRLIVVLGIAYQNVNQNGNGHLARNYTVRPRRRDAAYLQTRLLITQKEEIGIQLQAEEFDLMAATRDLNEIKEVNANCILMANLQQASISGGNPNPKSTLQVLPSFEEYTLPVTYPEEVEETLGTPIEAEPLDKTQLEDLGLNTCNHDIPLSFREIPSFDQPKPQPQPLPNCPPLDVCLGNERGLKPPIKSHSPDSFRMKVLDDLTIRTPPSSLVASFHPKDTYCYYHPCIDDPKKHYQFKPGHNSPVRPKEVEKEDLDRDGECGFDYLTFALVSSKAHREGVGLHVADSHTGNHPEDGFMPLETTRRLLVVIGRRSYSGFEGDAFELKDEVISVKDTIVVQRCGLSAMEWNEFLSFYPIPSEYDVILPTSTQTIFNAPPDSIISSKYLQLLLDENKLDSKSFKDKLPPNIDENLYFQRLGRYPTSVRVFDDRILFLAGLKPSWEFGQQRPAIIVGDKEPSPGFGIGSLERITKKRTKNKAKTTKPDSEWKRL